MKALKRFMVVLVCTLAGGASLPISLAFAGADCNEMTASQPIDTCAGIAKKAADSRLNASYQKLMARLDSQYRVQPDLGQAFKAKVKESQRIWIKLRDTDCPLEAFENETGMPAYVTTVSNCVARMSLERSDYLDKIAPDL
ncbi:lysozyme inhibitor LprI family protein [Pseudomonas frederiksbergensis]|uniref:lysozyme inhibitor LprI family protein n=1 Tax=Pseudomonas frederiksbergensis TaxID=104087 RepID=UPI001F220368|nr:lysozyme inhibitor LprI family protein [Pseudomonas frederiksbergensis]